jgi:hypothetical protein
VKGAAGASSRIKIPVMKEAAGPVEKMHISFIKGAAAPSSKIDIPLSKEAAGKIGISFMKGRPLLQVK